MKIVYFIIAYGPEFISNEVHEELGLRMRERGHEFVALTLTGSDPLPASPSGGGAKEASPTGGGVNRLQRSESQNGIPIYKIRVGGHQQRLAQTVLHYNNFFAVLDGYKHFLRDYGRPDIVHAEAAYPLGAIATLGTSAGGPRIIPNLQGADVLNYPDVDYGYGRYRAARYLLRRTFASAAMVRCNSAMMRDLIISAYGCAPAKAKVILRNIGSWSFLPANTDLPAYRIACRAKLEQDYPQLQGHPFILSISRLHPFKGIEYLLEALALYKPDEAEGGINPALTTASHSALPVLIIAGPGRSTAHFGDYAALLKRKAAELGIADRVIFTGEIPYTQSRDYLAAADVVAISSVVDALNKVALEAAAVGTPTLLTSTTGAAPYVEQEGLGIVVPPRSSPALADGLRQALAADISLRAMQRGPAWAEQFRSVPIADQLLEMYEEALKLVIITKFKIQNPKSKIAYIAYPLDLNLQAANSVQTWHTARELRRLAPDTLIIVPKLPGQNSRFGEAGARYLPRVPVGKLSKFHKSTGWYYIERSIFALLAFFYLLWRRLRGRKVAVIYSRDVIITYWLATIWKRLLGVKLIYEVHEVESEGSHRARGRFWQPILRRIDRGALTRSDGLASLTHAFIPDALKLGVPKQRIAVIPDAFDEQVYYPRAKAAARTMLDLPADATIFAYAGLTFAYRGLDLLVDAFADMVATEPQQGGINPAPTEPNSVLSPQSSVLILLGGKDSEQAALREQAARLGIADRVLLLGRKDAATVAQYLAAADALLIPDTVTKATASPLKLFEYMAMARPIILPALPALQEVLPDDAARYFAPGDRDALAAALRWVLANPIEAVALGEEAHRLSTPYTYAARAAQILAFCRRIVGRLWYNPLPLASCRCNGQLVWRSSKVWMQRR